MSLSFEQLGETVAGQTDDISPAELHGWITAYLCVNGGEVNAQAYSAWREAFSLSGPIDSDEPLWQQTAAALGEGFSFHLLLPSADTALSSRIAALALWCGGFLAGYAEAIAASQTRVEGPITAETLADLEAISRAEADDEERGEEAERDFFELCEYVRLAAVSLSVGGGGEERAVDPAVSAEPKKADAISSPRSLFGGGSDDEGNLH